ncbi:MAG: YitT family protein [Oscillospiraceae bacterium]|nr:YitT family protein [Oscillospiraceae bacterium]
MGRFWQKYKWIFATIFGSTVFSAGFAFFLQPNDMSPGGISGLALVIVELLGFGSVGMLSILINLPLFLLGGMKIGKRFFLGSLLGMLLSSVLIDGFAALGLPGVEPLMGVIYGGVVCGFGLGVVFVSGTSTGGSDILVRLLKLKYRNVPIGQISMCFDAVVVLLTGLVFRDLNKALYTGITVYLCGKVVDAVVYRFDYSKVALIITSRHEEIARQIGLKLDRGATFLHGEGSYSGQPTKVVLAAVKRQQVTELKELVMAIDPNAFVIVQEAHQVLGDGFSRYAPNGL